MSPLTGAACAPPEIRREGLHHENAVAIERISDRCAGQGDDLLGRARVDVHIGEHARPKLPVLVVESGRAPARCGYPGRRAHRQSRSRRGKSCRDKRRPHFDRLARLQDIERFLGNREIDVNRIELLQGDEARSRRNILSEIHFADAEPARERRGDLFWAMMARTRSTAAAAESRAASAESKFALAVLPALVSSRCRCKRQIGVLQHREIVLEVGLLHELSISKEGRPFRRPGPTRP